MWYSGGCSILHFCTDDGFCIKSKFGLPYIHCCQWHVIDCAKHIIMGTDICQTLAAEKKPHKIPGFSVSIQWFNSHKKHPTHHHSQSKYPDNFINPSMWLFNPSCLVSINHMVYPTVHLVISNWPPGYYPGHYQHNSESKHQNSKLTFEAVHLKKIRWRYAARRPLVLCCWKWVQLVIPCWLTGIPLLVECPHGY